MAGNIHYKLTLQSEGINSGPYYNVTYTTSSIFYPVNAGSPAFLPNVGSTAIVGIESGSYIYLAFNLNNGVGEDCEYCNNDVLYTVQGCPCVCGATIINQAGTPISYSYQDCNGASFSGSIPLGATGSLPCGDSPLYVQISSITTTGPASITYGACGTQPTTTTTSTTTTTTTAAPTTTTTSTTTTTTTAAPFNCVCYLFFNETGTSDDVTYTPCGGAETTESVGAGQSIRRCVDFDSPAPSSATITIVACTSTVSCVDDSDCTLCT
jgi:hypothetical protein